MNECQTIHETIVRDIVSMIIDGAKEHDLNDGFLPFGKARQKSFRSISKASSNLILTFPVIVSSTVGLEEATMICKSHERKCANMMQMLFSALCVSDGEVNVYDYLKRFHVNLNFDDDDVNVDNFVDAMDQLSDAAEEAAKINDHFINQLINEDMKNLDYSLSNRYINPVSITDFKVKTDKIHLESSVIAPISEGAQWINIRRSDFDRAREASRRQGEQQGRDFASNAFDQQLDLARDREEELRRQLNQTQRSAERWHRTARTHYRNERNLRDRLNRTGGGRGERDRDAYDDANYLKNRSEYFKNQMLDNDVKKANELMPTTMIVTFYSPEAEAPVSAVIGIKAKMYIIDTEEVINRLVVRNKDNHGFHNFLRAMTREISFFKDFVFAVDKAKIDALSSSKKGSDSKVWKLLERRATKSKIRRAFGMSNDASAITTVVVSQQEVDTMIKEYSVHIDKVPVIKPIMDAYNLMAFVIVDDTVEKIRFLYDDGSNKFEDLTFRSLERDTQDSSYKKIVNLMSKVAR